MEDFVYYGLLFDIYKNQLSDVSKEYFSLYYEENLTLQEIADNKNVSKSYVGNVIKKTTNHLKSLESDLKIYEQRKQLEELLNINDLNTIKKSILTIIGE